MEDMWSCVFGFTPRFEVTLPLFILLRNATGNFIITRATLLSYLKTRRALPSDGITLKTDDFELRNK